MEGSDLGPAVEEASAWIRSAICRDPSLVCGWVPAGFAAHVRLLHPPARADGSRTTWAAVARETERIVHPLVQWHALVDSEDPDSDRGSLWGGSPPTRGSLSADIWTHLGPLLRANTAPPTECFFAFWEGWEVVQSIAVPSSDVGKKGSSEKFVREPPPRPTWRESVTTFLSLPHDRRYGVLRGQVECGSPDRDDQSGIAPTGRSPNLMWPADRGWFLATEVDFDSTLIGGSAGLAEAILSDSALEAWPVSPRDSLAWDSDQINVV
jgi:hypothetical protein